MSAPAHPSLFAPMPLRAMATGLSGLELSVLICVAAHDRLSLVTGKGQGCRASNLRMSTLIGCSYARLCTTLRRLEDLGFLAREKLGRHTVYRVIYTNDDTSLFGNLSGRSKGPESESPGPDICCQHSRKRRGKEPKTPPQYIPLSGEKYSVETGKETAPEGARAQARSLGNPVFDGNTGAHLARLERALKSGDKIDCLTWYDWLADASFDENPTNRAWASRLCEDLVSAMDDREYEQWLQPRT